MSDSRFQLMSSTGDESSVSQQTSSVHPLKWSRRATIAITIMLTTLFLLVLLLQITSRTDALMGGSSSDELTRGALTRSRRVAPALKAPIDCSSLSNVSCVRKYLTAYAIDAYIVPSGDAHNSEYVAEWDRRLRFVSNFTGSAGTAVVIADSKMAKSRIFVDSRYYIQVEQQIDPNEWDWSPAQYTTWIASALPSGSFVGIDPTLIRAQNYRTLRTSLASVGITLVSVADNLCDLAWGPARPPQTQTPLVMQSLNFTGETAASKIQRTRALLPPQNCVAAVLSALDNIAWLTNLRGGDVLYNPVFFSYVVITMQSTILYVDIAKITTVDLIKYLFDQDITVRPYTQFEQDLDKLNAGLSPTRRIWMSAVNAAVYDAFDPQNVYQGASLVGYMQAVKNSAEIAAMRVGHAKDGASFAVFFDWLERELSNDRYVDECSASVKIEEIRRTFPNFVSLAYGSITGSGVNGALPHYTPVAPTCAQIDKSHTLLIDSGSQFLETTTDTTRTWSYDQSTFFFRTCFTLVLQGHIDQMLKVWPQGETPNDWSARQPLLRYGLTYGHGTSHGVGQELFVHEDVPGPTVAGIIQSIEPAFYFPYSQNNSDLEKLFPGYNGAGFGVRHESDVLVVEHPTPLNSNTRYYTYDPIAFVPIQTNLLRTELMTDQQIDWLNAYHQRTWDVVSPWLQNQPSTALDWLKRWTRPISK